RMRRQHPRELRTQRFAWVGFLARQYKGRMNFAAVALQSDLAPRLRVITGPVVGDRVAILIRDHADAGLAEEGRHRPEIAALLRDQVEADLFEEALAAVTGDALVVDAEEDAPRIDDDLIRRVFVVVVVHRQAGDVPARQEARGRGVR